MSFSPLLFASIRMVRNILIVQKQIEILRDCMKVKRSELKLFGILLQLSAFAGGKENGGERIE